MSYGTNVAVVDHSDAAALMEQIGESAADVQAAIEAENKAGSVDVSQFAQANDGDKPIEGDAPASNDEEQGLIAKLVGVLNMIVAGDANHAALTTKASEHTPEQIRQVYGYLNVELGDDDLPKAVETLQKAKDALLDELTKPASDEPTQTDIEDAIAQATGGKPKKGKKTAKGRAKKAKAEPKPKASEIPVPLNQMKVEAAGVTLKEERTKLVPLPEHFYLEQAEPRTTTGALHQVDPSRVQSCTPVMPNLDLFNSTGNPYPAEPNDTVVTGAKYQPFVKISHVTWAHFVRSGGELTFPLDQSVVADLLVEAGVKNDTDARTCVQDTLRDCALYGLCTQTRFGRKRVFKLGAPTI